MPIFEYRCSACGHKFEELSFGCCPEETRKCPKCGKDKVEKALSSFASPGGAGAASPGCGTGKGRMGGG